jgi:hypothetical protein
VSPENTSLVDWIKLLNRKIGNLVALSKSQESLAYDLGSFFNPSHFITVTRQIMARKLKRPIESLKLKLRDAKHSKVQEPFKITGESCDIV